MQSPAGSIPAGLLGCRKTPLEFFDNRPRPAARTSCPPKADSLHTCRPECIFPDVHAAGKNDLHVFRACGRETLRGFFDTLKAPQGVSLRGFAYDRVCKPGSVIDSHLSRRTVAGALQPPSRRQPGKPCLLCGVAPDRVYSGGHSRATGCALTAPFHPYCAVACSISLASPQAAKLVHFAATPFPSFLKGRGLAGRSGISLLHFS